MLNLFTATTLSRRFSMPGSVSGGGTFQVPTDPWYIFKCPQLVHFGCPSSLRPETHSLRLSEITASGQNYEHISGDIGAVCRERVGS
jgi:hypothetical protein